MIEIDSEIINADTLMTRVEKSAKKNKISSEFYNGFAGHPQDEINILSIKGEMLSIYQKIQMLDLIWKLEEKPIHSERPVIGKLIIFLKRICRKLTRWQFQEYYQQQSDFNRATMDVLSEMMNIQDMLITLNERDNEEKNVED